MRVVSRRNAIFSPDDVLTVIAEWLGQDPGRLKRAVVALDEARPIFLGLLPVRRRRPASVEECVTRGRRPPAGQHPREDQVIPSGADGSGAPTTLAPRVASS